MAQNRAAKLEYNKRYYAKNCEALRRYRREYYKKYGAKPRPEYFKKYYQDHKAENRSARTEYMRNRRATNIAFRIRHNLASRLTQLVRKKHGSTVNMLGCPIADFKIYLESKFQVGMSWENYGRGNGKWHIDHIMPCALFDLSKLEHQYRCFHFSNLQPLWETDNLAKSKKTGPSQFQLL